MEASEDQCIKNNLNNDEQPNEDKENQGVGKENETPSRDLDKSPFSNKENIDCLDTEDKWLNAEITGVLNKKVLVHYSGFTNRWNEWIEWDSPRLLSQWKPGKKFQKNNRIDVKDTYNKWCEASVVEIDEKAEKIKIHYKGFTAKWDEELSFDSDRIAQIGSRSKAFGSGRKPGPEASYNHNTRGPNETEEQTQQRLERSQREDKFKSDLDEVGFRIFSIGADGNCLFRALSHQIYGDEDHFKYIRRRTMDYMEREKDYFKEFIPEEFSSVEEYIEHKRKNGIWGDNIEIQILAELYSCKIEIYAYQKEPLFTIGATNQDDRIVRLSFHQNSHYNSVVRKDKLADKDWKLSDTLGHLEDIAFAGLDLKNGDADAIENPSPELQRLQEGGHSIEQIKSAVEESRKGFQQEFQRDLDTVLAESRAQYEASAGGFSEEEKAIEESKKLFEAEVSEDEQIRQAIEASLGNEPDPVGIPQPISSEEDQLQAAMLASAMNSLNTGGYNQNELIGNPIVVQAVQLGFDQSLAIQAVMQFGHDQEAVLDYLFSLNLQN